MNRTVLWGIGMMLTMVTLTASFFAGMVTVDAKSPVPSLDFVNSGRALDLACAKESIGEVRLQEAQNGARLSLTEVMDLMTCYN